MKMTGLLPIGSIVRLKEGTMNIMITGYAQRKINQPGSFFDYAACPHPHGVTSADKTILFNQEDLDSVLSIGYIDDESLKFMENAETAIRQLREGMRETDHE